ncbi:MAG: GTPase, partial [Actinomycetota bacterium]
FGCRLAVTAVRGDQRQPVTTASALADRLLAESGVPALRAEVAQRFTTRRDLLKARQGLAAARHAALALRDNALASEVERITDGAHEFAELRVLNALRTGAVRFDEQRTRAAVVLLVESAIDIRLGLAGGAGEAEIQLAATEHLAMWQSQAEHPLATPDAAAAARVLTRTCEALLAASTSP